MKLLTVIYDGAIDRSFMSLLEDLEVKAWTKFYGAEGEGFAGLKLNTPVWPGQNNQILLVGAEETLRTIAAAIRAMQAEFKLRPGILMFMQDVDEL